MSNKKKFFMMMAGSGGIAPNPPPSDTRPVMPVSYFTNNALPSNVINEYFTQRDVTDVNYKRYLHDNFI